MELWGWIAVGVGIVAAILFVYYLIGLSSGTIAPKPPDHRAEYRSRKR